MADRPIAAIVADLRRHKVTQLVHPGDLLAVLDDWQRQADEIARLKRQGVVADGYLQDKLDAALAEAEALRTEVGKLLDLFIYQAKRQMRFAPKWMLKQRAALDRALTDPTKET